MPRAALPSIAEMCGVITHTHSTAAAHHPTANTAFQPAPPPQDITPTSLTLHYYSPRPGLTDLVVGILKGVAATFFGGLDVTFELLRSRKDATDDHDVFRLTYPPQDFDAGSLSWQAGAPCEAVGDAGDGAEYAASAVEFMALHPYHVLLDSGCRWGGGGTWPHTKHATATSLWLHACMHEAVRCGQGRVAPRSLQPASVVGSASLLWV